MSETAMELLKRVLASPEDERVMIADGIWQSLSEEARDQLPDDPTVDPDYRAELQRRLDEVEKHPERLIDGGQFMSELRARYEKDRKS